MAHTDLHTDDDGPALGIPPLNMLYGGTEAQGAPVPQNQPLTRGQTPDDEGMAGREFLARILLSLGESFGGKAPSFIGEELKERSRIRGEERAGAHLLERQRLNQEAILQRQEAAAQLKEKAERTKSEKMGRAAAEVNEETVRAGIETLDGSMMMQLENHLIRGGGWDPKQAREYVTAGVGRKWEQSKDGKSMIVTFNNGMQPKQFPLDTIQEVGKTIVQMRGTQPTGTYIPPTRETLGKGQRVMELPASTQGEAVAPPSGAIQQAGGVLPAQTQAGPRELVPAEPEQGAFPTAEQAPFLTKKGVATNLSWQEIETKYPGASATFLRDQESERTRRAVADATAKNEALAKLPFVIAFPQSGKVTFNKQTRMRDPKISSNDIVADKGVALDPTSARSVGQLQSALSALSRLERAATAILATSPGVNLTTALRLAVERKLASSDDLAEFDAITGPLRIQIASIINQGRPSDPDAQAISQGLPSGTDSVKTGVRRLRSTQKLLLDSVDGYLGNPVKPLLKKDLDLGDQTSKQGIPLSGGGKSDRSPFNRTVRPGGPFSE